MIQNRDPLAIDAQREWEEEQEELGQVDRSRYLYKFRALDVAGFTLKSLAERSLFCSHYKAFNDLFEFRFQYDRHPANTDKIFEQWRKDFPQFAISLSRKMIPIYGIEIMKLLLDDFGISCFAKDALNPLLWSYYADSYRGICLCFEFPQSGRNVFAMEHIHDVSYAEEPLTFDLLMLKDRHTLPDRLVPFVTRKHHIWRHENESRYVGFGKAKQLVSFQAGDLKEVIFGTNCPVHQRAEVKAVCAAAGMAPQFLSVQLNPWSYSLSLSYHS